MSELALHAAASSGKNRKLTFVAVGLAMMAAIMLAPTPTGLSVVGQRVIAVMAFTVFMWVTEAIPYGTSAVALVFLLIVSLGTPAPRRWRHTEWPR